MGGLQAVKFFVLFWNFRTFLLASEEKIGIMVVLQKKPILRIFRGRIAMSLALRTNPVVPVEIASNLFSASILEEPSLSANLPDLLHQFPVIQSASAPLKASHPWLLGNFSDYMASLKRPTSATGQSLLTQESIGLTVMGSSQSFNPLTAGLFFAVPESTETA
jgi:hypothetical protein